MDHWDSSQLGLGTSETDRVHLDNKVYNKGVIYSRSDQDYDCGDDKKWQAGTGEMCSRTEATVGRASAVDENSM